MLDTPLQTFEEFEADTAEIVTPFRSKFGAVWFHEIGRQKPTRSWIIKNLILAKTFGIVYGPPGCGKSFLVSDMMLTCCAAALTATQRTDWFGYKANAFGCIYVVAEGRDDFEIRLHAWRQEHDIPEDAVLPFVFLPTSIDMRSNDADTKKLAEEITAISRAMQRQCGVSAGVVVIDTVARALAGGNENDSQVMGSFVINCGKLQEITGATVLGVHHGGKEAGRGPRGHEALHGAADFEIEVSAATKEDPNVWVVRKLKAGPGGASHRFRLKQITIGNDTEGDPITSCVVRRPSSDDQAASTKPSGFKVRPREMEFLTCLSEAIDTHGEPPPPGLNIPSKVLLVVNHKAVRKVFFDKYSATESGTPEAIEKKLEARWKAGTSGLLKFRIIGAKEPWLWFTGREVQQFRIRGVAKDEAPPTYVEPADECDMSEFLDDGGQE